MVTDSSGTEIASGDIDYSEFGEHDGGSSDEYSYTGKKADFSAGLVYFNARYYFPEIGRFISMDPVKSGVNWYVYCENNPLKYVDPNGLEEIYFLFTHYTGTAKWQEHANLMVEKHAINAIQKQMTLSGLSVHVDLYSTRKDIFRAFEDPEAMLILISGHGFEDPGITDAQAKPIYPYEFENLTISKNLAVVIFAVCYQGKYTNLWESILGSTVRFKGFSDVIQGIDTWFFIVRELIEYIKIIEGLKYPFPLYNQEYLDSLISQKIQTGSGGPPKGWKPSMPLITLKR